MCCPDLIAAETAVAHALHLVGRLLERPGTVQPGDVAPRDFPELDDWRMLDRSVPTSPPRCSNEHGRGRYGQIEVNRGLPAHLLVKYFHRARDAMGDWTSAIRSMVRFERRNLDGAVARTSPMDLVLMRNVTIYFDLATKRELLARSATCWRRTDTCCSGSSETTLRHRWSLPTGTRWPPPGGTASGTRSPVRTGQG